MSKKREYGRPAGFRNLNVRFLILVEGEVTEKEYFHEVRRRLRLSDKLLQIVGPPPNTPKEMVQKAIELKAREKQAPYEQVWCVFDAEAKLTQKCRDGLQEALRVAKRAGIRVALSNPCFELWLVLHREARTSWQDSHEIQKRARGLGIIEEKAVLALSELLDSTATAARNAESLCEMHANNGTLEYERNPSTTVYKLVGEIYKRLRLKS
jgi:hypothetical protein